MLLFHKKILNNSNLLIQTGIYFQYIGAVIDELEDEDLRLAGNIAVDDQDDWLYMERPLNYELNSEMWNLSEEEINQDFTEQQNTRSSTLYHDMREGNSLEIIKWIMIFLSIWSSYCCISDNAMDILVSFPYTVFKCLGSIFPTMAGFALLFPKLFNLLKSKLGLNKDHFEKFVVLQNVEIFTGLMTATLYVERLARTKIEKCPFISQANQRQLFRRIPCGEPLLKEVTLKNGKKRLYPFKFFCYNSIIDNVKRFIESPNFAVNCELWRQRNIPQLRIFS
jgi:multidrug transporter EmrE-like cation transporter